MFKYAPGVQASWTVPGFYFLTTDVAALVDANAGLEHGGAPKTGNTWMLNVNWGAAITAAGQPFIFTGCTEYLGGTTDELGGDVRPSMLTQPQFMWDVGQAVAGQANQLFVGVEYQLWVNTLGTDFDESTALLLIVWSL